MSTLLELRPKTPAGASLVACAEELAQRLAVDAAEHDTRGHFPLHSVTLLKQAGYFRAPVPAQLGGRGVESLFDILVASSRLARGDPATTLGLNMHLQIVSSLVRRWGAARCRGDARRAAAFGNSLTRIVDEDVVIAAAVSEPNQHLTQPTTRAVRDGSGWSLDGHKIVCSMAPAATTLLVSTRYQNQAGEDLYGYAEVAADAPGVVIHDDWDALGMRASGSDSISFEAVHVPATALRGGFPIGSARGYIERNLANGLFHASAALGIAEAAQETALGRLRGRSAAELGPAEQMLSAENEIALAALRALFGRTAEQVEGFFQAQLAHDADEQAWHTMFAEVQATKLFVGETAGRVVDRALTLAGGAGYHRSHALARAYRDVRAVGFMQPLSSGRAYAYLAQTALGLEPALA
jgi:alkylation response protein AidB-like acyl-CoA dehydrogenase